jgi:hypothetical protein
MRRELVFSPDLSLPLDAVTQAIAFLARRGGGKTYGAGKLAEEMLRAEAQVVVLDPVGNWYGLRISADGKGKGFDIPVFGGRNGDIPLEPRSGRLVAQYVVERGISLVLDVSQFRKGQQKEFVADFAEELFELKKGDPSALHLIVEEAQRFAPQKVWKGAERMLGALEDLVKLGRNYGIGVSLLSQRPQAVNKDCLNQTECLIVLQTNGKQERKAIAEWISEKDVAEGDVKLEELPHLPTGTAFLWSPQWLRVLQKIRIGKKTTFDASATPKVGEKRTPPKPLAAEDLERLRGEMQEMVVKAEENDPKHLKTEVAKLKALLAKKDHVVPPVQARVVEKRVEVQVPLLTKDEQTTLKGLLDRLQELERVTSPYEQAMLNLHRALPKVNRVLDKLSVFKLETTPTPKPGLDYVHRTYHENRVIEEERARTRARAREEGDEALPSGGALKMLQVLAQRHPTELSKKQLATLSGFKVSGGSFRTYVSFLRVRGYMEGKDDFSLAQKGLDFLGELPEQPKNTDELVAMWLSKLEGKARDMLKILVDEYPTALDKTELASRLEMEAGGGSFRTYLSKLCVNGLAVSNRTSGQVCASESLFL